MIAAHRIDLERLCLPWNGAPLPFAVVELDHAGPLPLVLPPFPLIGVGDSAAPLAATMDAVVDPPVSLDALIAAIERQPRTAAIAVQLLRLIEKMPVTDALLAESLAYGLLQGSAAHDRWLATALRPATAEPGVLHAVRDGAVLRVEIDRPAARNAIDVALRDQLRSAFELAALDPDIAEIILGARGRTFSIGADLAEFGTTRDPATAHAIRMATLPAPLIAAVADRLTVRIEGACIGAGLEMAAFAGRVIAAPDAWFQLPELAMGLIPGAGGCVSMARRIGRQRTALMILSGRRIGVQTALRWGLVDEIAGNPGGADVLGAQA